MTQDIQRKRKFTRIILAYPLVLALIALAVNLLIFGVAPAQIALPAKSVVTALSLSAALLLIIHTWLMTSTELTRLRFNIHATPEEWDASDHARTDVTPQRRARAGAPPQRPPQHHRKHRPFRPAGNARQPRLTG